MRVTRSVTVPEPDLTSAEWIAEAPSACSSTGRCRTVPLANFGSVSFTRTAATGDAHAGTITDPARAGTPILLAESSGSGFGPFGAEQPSSGRSGATPGTLSADGRAFIVAWRPAS